MKNKAFSLVELMVVIGIVFVVAGLSTPVLIRSKERAQVQASLGRLKQLHLAVELYRTDYDLFDDMNPQHFPPYSYVYSTYLGFGIEFFVSPCGYKSGIEDNRKHISYQYYPFFGAASSDYFAKYGANAMLFRDPHCTDALSWNSSMMIKRGLGVTVGGRLVNLVKRGMPHDPSWWTEP